MPFVPLEFPPGIYRNGTERQSKGRWYDCNFVRFYNGCIIPVPGSTKRSVSAITGKGRRVIVWRDNSLTRWCAVGTESHLYAMNYAGTLYDITPAGFVSGTANAPLDGNGYPTADVT